MPTEYQNELDCVITAAKSAAEILRPAFHARYDEQHDKAAEALIQEILLSAFPRYGYLGEELGHPRAPQDAHHHLWVVDPHDGTKAALEGFRGSAISIALLKDGAPVVGVVLAYAAPDDGGDLFYWAAGMRGIWRNGIESLRVWPATPDAQHTALTSQHADNKSLANSLLLQPLRYRAVPSIAYRLALVAAGDGELAISLNHPTTWDIAGGHALLLGTGGDLFDQAGRSVRYDRFGRLISRITSCFGGGSSVFCLPFCQRDWQSLFQKSSQPPASKSLTYLKAGETISDAALLERAHGCMLGQFGGDALGSLVEFQSSEQIAAAYPDGPDLLHDGGHWDTIAGQPTDDSELALALARSILANDGYSIEAAAVAYANWMESSPFDVGMATGTALRPAAKALSCGLSVAQAARLAASRKTQANGALMRVSPLGIFGVGLSDEQLHSFAVADASLTHPDEICQGASAVFASALAFAIRTQSSPAAIYDHALAFALRHRAAEALVERLSMAQTAPPPDFDKNEGWVLIAFHNAFFRLLHSQTLERGIVETVRAGGDTDTNAAIAGALLGAAYGRRAVPKQWQDRILSCRPQNNVPGVLKPRPPQYWPVDALEIAECLLVSGLRRSG